MLILIIGITLQENLLTAAILGTIALSSLNGRPVQTLHGTVIQIAE